MKEQYKYVKNLIDKDLRNYLTSFSLSEPIFTPDVVVPQSHSTHSKDYIIYKHLLHFLKPRIEKETSLSLKPIYCYSRLYLEGAKLVKHKDRPSCETSVSLTLNFSYVDKKYKWPLCIENLPIVIKIGDGVIYKGCEVQHWRPIFTQPKPSWHHQVFLHYVNKNGPYEHLKEELTTEIANENKNYLDSLIDTNL